MAGSPEAVAQAARLLLDGQIVALPTETVYGLAANALSSRACTAIFKAKGRPLEDPLICHVLDANAAEQLAVLTPLARALMERFWPGPLTLIMPKRACVPKIVTAGLPTVAVRSPAHPLMRSVLAACGLPLAAPSANPFGYISPTCAQHVWEQLGDRVPLIVDGGPCALGLESTILDISGPHPAVILRLGPLTAEQLEPVLGFLPQVAPKNAPMGPAGPVGPAGPAGPLIAPGLLERHYSPKCPASLFSQMPPVDTRPHACLFFKKPAKYLPSANCRVFWLSEDGDVHVAAQRLYAQLRILDTLGLQHLYLQQAPGADGLSSAINERLGRACSGNIAENEGPSD